MIIFSYRKSYNRIYNKGFGDDSNIELEKNSQLRSAQ